MAKKNGNKNYLKSGLSASEKKKIVRFSDFIFDIHQKVSDECEENEIERDDNQLFCRLSECVGALEQLIQDEF